MKKLITLTLLLTAVSGCTTFYSRADGSRPSDQAWARDYAQCETMGLVASSNFTQSDPWTARVIRDRTSHNCLVGKGYVKVKRGD